MPLAQIADDGHHPSGHGRKGQEADIIACAPDAHPFAAIRGTGLRDFKHTLHPRFLCLVAADFGVPPANDLFLRKIVEFQISPVDPVVDKVDRFITASRYVIDRHGSVNARKDRVEYGVILHQDSPAPNTARNS
ncbi:hypothetical protein SDC9_101965 [bioreactor metagenome]|uniref:Uncharacterized protein n=1 Tax=bioreactor metagenome TaxID=1076179 RepID=A0A645API3_9ZZZZ